MLRFMVAEFPPPVPDCFPQGLDHPRVIGARRSLYRPSIISDGRLVPAPLGFFGYLAFGRGPVFPRGSVSARSSGHPELMRAHSD